MEFKIDDIKQLKVLLQSNTGYDASGNDQNWTKEAIANLGITSLEEFEEFIQNRGGSNQFDHTSKPDYEMFKFAQQLISRAKKNVISYLSNLPEYNCEDLEELSTTILNKSTGEKYKKGILNDLPGLTRNKLYVAITRARGNVYLIDE